MGSESRMDGLEKQTVCCQATTQIDDIFVGQMFVLDVPCLLFKQLLLLSTFHVLADVNPSNRGRKILSQSDPNILLCRNRLGWRFFGLDECPRWSGYGNPTSRVPDLTSVIGDLLTSISRQTQLGSLPATEGNPSHRHPTIILCTLNDLLVHCVPPSSLYQGGGYHPSGHHSRKMRRG